MLLSAALVTACASQPKKDNVGGSAKVGQREGQWHGNFSVKDKRTNKSNNLVIDALGKEPEQLRLEITTQMGIPVASIVVNGDRLQALLPQQKRYIDAPATAQSMGKLAQLQIEPQVLMDIFFGKDLADRKGWECDKNAEQRCTHSATSAAVLWSRKDGEPRKFSLESPRAEGNFSINSVKTKVEFDEKTFSVQAPSSYKVQKL